MGLDDAYMKAAEAMAHIDPRAAALASGAGYMDDRFITPMFDRTYTVHFPSCKTAQIGSGSCVPRVIEVLLMHYLTQADGAAISGDWISYRQLPGAKLFEKRFENLVLWPMLDFFSNDIEGFRAAAEALGGREADLKGDAAFLFTALPRVPVACIFNAGEEEIPSSINMLFDGSAYHYLSTEDLTILGGIMSSLMKNIAKTDGRKT